MSLCGEKFLYITICGALKHHPQTSRGLLKTVCEHVSRPLTVNHNLRVITTDWARIAPQPVAQQVEPSSGANQNPSKPATKGRTSRLNDKNVTQETSPVYGGFKTTQVCDFLSLCWSSTICSLKIMCISDIYPLSTHCYRGCRDAQKPLSVVQLVCWFGPSLQPRCRRQDWHGVQTSQRIVPLLDLRSGHE